MQLTIKNVKDESGVVILIAPALIIILLMMGALAIDLSYAGRAKNVMNKAADSAAIAALDFRIYEGWTVATTQIDGEARILDVAFWKAYNNLVLGSILPENAVGNFGYTRTLCNTGFGILCNLHSWTDLPNDQTLSIQISYNFANANAEEVQVEINTDVDFLMAGLIPGFGQHSLSVSNQDGGGQRK